MTYLMKVLKQQAEFEKERQFRLGSKLAIRTITSDDRRTWKKSSEDIGLINAPWNDWLLDYFPTAFVDSRGRCHPLAPFQHIFFAWVWDLIRGERPEALINCWFRGAAKSTFLEMIPAIVGALASRSYILYVSNTQDQANDHVQNIANRLSSHKLEEDFPALCERAVTEYGQSKGWRRNRLRTASGLTIDALGMDTTRFRGLKIDDQRPDMIIFDDIDDATDSLKVMEKNIAQLKKSILPAGSDDVAVVFGQNKVRNDGIMGMLVDGTADFLARRIMNGPIPAINNMEFEFREGRDVITAGSPTWIGKDMERCQKEVEDEGISAFLEENQHVTTRLKGGIFDHLEGHYPQCNHDEVPDLAYIVVWVDPAVSSTAKSDCQGIQVSGLSANGDKIFKLRSSEQRGSPEAALTKAISWAAEFKAMTVGVETDQGGDLWKSTYYRTCEDLKMPKIPFSSAKAGASQLSKIHRVGQQIHDYEVKNIVHVRGTHVLLESALNRFPIEPDDLCDADWHAWNNLTQFRSSDSGTYFNEYAAGEFFEQETA